MGVVRFDSVYRQRPIADRQRPTNYNVSSANLWSRSADYIPSFVGSIDYFSNVCRTYVPLLCCD
jgi:hypothetical protein